ncbi:hypothetical protein DMB91_06465 [Campylobacter sp. MIT 97-5078]|nr:hypothetical protein [Campylobacter sp. MIT 97-5078]KGI56352.1 hypothetical protein LR59_07470 [Campylobacter sp. MIT 97-5078]KGI56856.1 hypothetical protein LR59_05135 [Campylobacter sp. MIT 97-5078]KGI56933.1 hypothetical protein LR59_05590 [Campylobacter sp. MIT 97-5078]TQR26690.1 hypothetical protein DMB91_06465 [Campylobacter sp. MIT 97-5078]
MYMQNKDLRVLKTIQKAREFSDFELSNEQLVSDLIKAELATLNIEQREYITSFLNQLIESKNKALLSNK